ncbi:MAG: endopeptidase La [Chloroflexi bacterium]|nr:MAG: endopeptidase La [Chloroflexota bacterium]RLC87155.1 MAG: endopeptidase La [Chloroflexota bacterium]HEY72646.1 endopeptidase La [Thermoflexia bacterium]
MSNREKEAERLEDLLGLLSHPLTKSDRDSSSSDGKESGLIQIPTHLPILPLRGLVVFPMTAVPIRIGQPRSVRLIDDAMLGKQLVGLVASRDPEVENPGPDDVYRVGTVAAVHRLFKAPDGTLTLIMQGLLRIYVEEFTGKSPYLTARVIISPEKTEKSLEIEALQRNITDGFHRLNELVSTGPEQMSSLIVNLEDPLQLTYAVANQMKKISLEDAQQLLELDSVTEKLHMLLGLLTKELEVLELGRKIQTEAQSEMQKTQQEYFLREQLKAIRRKLGEEDEQQIEVEEFREKVESSGMPEEAEKETRRELDRLSKLPTAAAEYSVIRTYLDWLTSLPWDTQTEDNLEIIHARQVLDEDHYDLEDIKERILEYLAVRKLREERREEFEQDELADLIRREREGVILCFVGPPGTGKTSLGQSIARALGRKFIRQSLGGVRDEAEIRGHRRTYIGAMPGRIIQALRRVESNNPVFMLDEVDKLGKDFRGDPASALLEVLDPEQNREFRDHYLGVPFDLSQVMFITTANLLDPIPAPLRDRMEILKLSGYTETEKAHIAQGYLIPRQLRENGLRSEELAFTEGALRKIIQDYTREAGVRNLEREIGRVCRKVVTGIAEGNGDPVRVTARDVPKFLKKQKYFPETALRTQLPGVATGLGVTIAGGDLMFFEATKMPGSKGFTVTGQLGEVMKESAQAALSYVRAKSEELGIPQDIFDSTDIHLHVPAGAVPKDGPSAGVTMATALASLLTERQVRDDVGMTGEITLRGQVLPVGGIKEKVLAAHRAGLKTVILPKQNQNDLDDIPDEVQKELTFVLAERVNDVFEAAICPQ